MSSARNWWSVRGRLSAGLMLAAVVVSSAAAPGQDAVHYQQGVPYDVTLDHHHVMIVTDGSVPHVQRAIDLAARGLASSMLSVGDSSTVFDVRVSDASPAIMAELQQQPGVLAAYPVIRFTEGGQPFGITGDVVVKFAANVTAAQRTTFANDYGLALQQQTTDQVKLSNVYVFRALAGDALDLVPTLQLDNRLDGWKAHADLVAPRVLKQSAPQDEFFDEQWHLDNRIGGSNREGGDIEALEAWETTTGAGIRIGMHDDGCDVQHEDLLANFSGFSSGGIGNAPTAIGFGHGTAVMGLMAAVPNTIGVRGVAPDAEFVPTSFANSFTSDAGAFTFAIENDVDVHNNSWGYPFGILPDIVLDSISAAANKGRNGRGIVVLFASGNQGIELDQGDDLSTLPEVIGVGATGQTDVIASYSNYGRSIDIMGPSGGDDGISLTTTDITGSGGFNDGNLFFDLLGAPNYTKTFSGTSGACPVVTGVAALVLAVNPDLNRAQVREILTHTADQVSPNDAQYSGASGFSQRYAYGRVNAARAVEAAKDSRVGNTTWPGVPRDVSIGIGEGEDDLIANISWIPSGMPPDEAAGEEPDDIETDEVIVLVAYLVPGQQGPPQINWKPVDGVAYTGCDPNTLGTCQLPSPGANPNLVILFSGAPTTTPGNERRGLFGLPIAGNDPDDEQVFAIFAANSRLEYSFGFSFDELGEEIGIGGDSGGVIVPPPDQGRPGVGAFEQEPGLNDPPSVTATADRTICEAPCEIEFHGGAVTPNQIVDRGWSFGDGSTSTADAAMHTYQFPGTYNAVFFAMDDDEPNGRISTKLIQVNVGSEDDTDGGIQPGLATAQIVVQTPPPYTAPNAQIRFAVDTTGVGESSSSTSVSYFWDFGDGNQGVGQTTENIFRNPGFYSVLVMITEQFSNAPSLTLSASAFVQVQGTAAGAGQIQPSGLPSSNSNDNGETGSGTCGMVGPGFLAVAIASFAGWRRRKRRRP